MHRSQGTDIHPDADGSGRCGLLVKVERIRHGNNDTHRDPRDAGASGTHGGASQPSSTASCADKYGHSNSDGNADTATCANSNAVSSAYIRH